MGKCRIRIAAVALSAGMAGLLAPPAQAAVSTVTGANAITVQSPVVTRPAMKVPVAIVLGNSSAKPTRVQVSFSGWCWDAASRRIAFSRPVKTVTVPGDLSKRGKGVVPLLRVADTITVPANCVAQPDLPGSPATQDGEFFGDYNGVGDRLKFAKLSHFWIGKSFTLTNIRYNLALKNHQTPASSQAHHTLPQKWADTFTRVGLNIHDPANLRWWCSKAGVTTNHQAKARQYNTLWDSWFTTHKNATAREMISYRNWIQGRFVYGCPGVRNYPGFP